MGLPRRSWIMLPRDWISFSVLVLRCVSLGRLPSVKLSTLGVESVMVVRTRLMMVLVCLTSVARLEETVGRLVESRVVVALTSVEVDWTLFSIGVRLALTRLVVDLKVAAVVFSVSLVTASEPLSSSTAVFVWLNIRAVFRRVVRVLSASGVSLLAKVAILVVICLTVRVLAVMVEWTLATVVGRLWLMAVRTALMVFPMSVIRLCELASSVVFRLSANVARSLDVLDMVEKVSLVAVSAFRSLANWAPTRLVARAKFRSAAVDCLVTLAMVAFRAVIARVIRLIMFGMWLCTRAVVSLKVALVPLTVGLVVLSVCCVLLKVLSVELRAALMPFKAAAIEVLTSLSCVAKWVTRLEVRCMALAMVEKLRSVRLSRFEDALRPRRTLEMCVWPLGLIMARNRASRLSVRVRRLGVLLIRVRMAEWCDGTTGSRFLVVASGGVLFSLFDSVTQVMLAMFRDANRVIAPLCMGALVLILIAIRIPVGLGVQTCSLTIWLIGTLPNWMLFDPLRFDMLLNRTLQILHRWLTRMSVS